MFSIIARKESIVKNILWSILQVTVSLSGKKQWTIYLKFPSSTMVDNVGGRRKIAAERRPRGEQLFRQNWELFINYRFCLVMENSYTEGYITEKILFAFLASCVPVYHGTEEVFNLFNQKVFIFYNISNPRVAFDKISYLESNQSAYDNILKEPVLAQGNSTIEQYFSLGDDAGGEYLKDRIRDLISF